MNSNIIIKNVAFGCIYKIISIVIKFILRAVLIKGLGAELVGLNTVLTDWMSMLNLATLGIEVAIQFSLYEPIAKKDNQQKDRIIRSAQIVYRKIGLFILCAGLLLMPCLPYLIKDAIYKNVYVYGAYLISLIGVSASYLWCYKRIIIQAYEEVYIVNIIDIVCEIFFISLEIFAIIKFKSLYCFLALGSIKLICQHAIGSLVCDRRYGIYKTTERYKDKESEIVSDLKDVAPLKLANYIYGYTDNVLISKYVGLAAVTIYSNYMIIINALVGISTMIVNATKSSFGIQLNLSEDKSKTNQKLEQYIFLQYVLALVSALSFYGVIDSFICMWVGDTFLIKRDVLVLMAIEIFIRLIYQPLQMMFEATGSFKKDKWITIGSAILNIVISLILVNTIGLVGPVIGTLVTDFVIWFYRMKFVQWDYFQLSPAKCLRKWGMYILSFGVAFFIVRYFRKYIENMLSGLGFLIVGEIGIISVALLIVFLFFFRTDEFRYCRTKIKAIVGRAGRR